MKRMLLFLILFGCFFSAELFPQSADIYTGNVDIYVNSYGRIRLYTTSATDTLKQIERISGLVATAPDAVFDYQNDWDVEEPTTLVDPPSWGDYEIYGAYNNVYSGLPPNIIIRMHIYAWENQSFAVTKYVVVNNEASTVDANIGLDYIPQVDDSIGGDNYIFNSEKQIIEVNKSGFVGLKLLSGTIESLAAFEYISDYYVDTSYYRWMTGGIVDTSLTTTIDDPVIIASQGSVNIASGDSVTFYFAFAYGDDKTEMEDNIAAAVDKYNSLTDIVDFSNNIPANFSLMQNYPNPFNPSTKISFTLSKKEFTTLKIYNSMGQEVTQLINSELSEGKYSYSFDASNFASGIYFYTLTSGNFKETKKMILLK